MIEPAELFARLKCEIEDLHGIAIAGQGQGLSTDERVVYCHQICNGLQRVDTTVRSIKIVLGSIT